MLNRSRNRRGVLCCRAPLHGPPVSPSAQCWSERGRDGTKAWAGRAEGTVKINALVHAMQRIITEKDKHFCAELELSVQSLIHCSRISNPLTNDFSTMAFSKKNYSSEWSFESTIKQIFIKENNNKKIK